MRLLIVLVALLTFSAGCNRPVTKVVADQSTPEKVVQPRPREPNNSILSGRASEQQIEEEVVPESSRISKRLRPEPTPAFKIDSVTGEKTPTVLVELKESGCIQDTCQQFTIQLLADYTFRYVGIANVDLLGEFTGKADFNPLLKIGPLTSKTGFFRMDEIYPGGTNLYEVASSVTTIYADHRGRKNEVIGVTDAPTGFQELEAEILSWVDRVIWVPVE
jgi:hypothetical protein